MWVQAIGLFARATCAPEYWLPRPFNQRLHVLHVGGGAVKQRVKFKTNKFQNKKRVQKEKEKKSIWLTVFSSKNIDIHVTSFYHSRNFFFLERSELSRIGVIWLNPSTEKILQLFIILEKFFLWESNHLSHSSLLQGCENKTMMDTSKPYTGAMKGTMHKPQANLRAD